KSSMVCYPITFVSNCAHPQFAWPLRKSRYVLEKRDSLCWRVLIPSQNPPSYLPYIKNEALHQQYDYIRKFYSEPEKDWFSSRPYHYLNENTVSRIVDESVQAVLLVHNKLQGMQDLDRLKSSISLLPEAWTMPYESPLGN
ncbi:MAG: hypothetical protein M3R47_10220, partial [Chloroflexota bacterium]|nr:hypothetical protein [Chloroflexota bacterium]